MRHMRTQAWLTAAALVVATTAGLPAQQGGGDVPADAEYVYIDSRQLLQEAPGATEARKQWQQEMSEFRSEIDRLRSELDSLQSSYQQQEETLTESAREQRRQEIAEKQRQLQRRVQELEQKAGQRRQELLAPILDEVRSVIQEIREEQGYSMVFDAAASGLLAADPRLDITDRVVERLRERDGDQGDDQGAGAQGDGTDPEGA